MIESHSRAFSCVIEMRVILAVSRTPQSNEINFYVTDKLFYCHVLGARGGGSLAYYNTRKLIKVIDW